MGALDGTAFLTASCPICSTIAQLTLRLEDSGVGPELSSTVPDRWCGHIRPIPSCFSIRQFCAGTFLFAAQSPTKGPQTADHARGAVACMRAAGCLFEHPAQKVQPGPGRLRPNPFKPARQEGTRPGPIRSVRQVASDRWLCSAWHRLCGNRTTRPRIGLSVSPCRASKPFQAPCPSSPCARLNRVG